MLHKFKVQENCTVSKYLFVLLRIYNVNYPGKTNVYLIVKPLDPNIPIGLILKM